MSAWTNPLGWIKSDRPVDEDERLLDEILRRSVYSYDGTSQYVGGSASACGLASMNAVRCVLELEYRRGLKGMSLIETVATKDLVENVVSICSSWKSPAHLDMEDIYALPLFAGPLDLYSADFKQTAFRELEFMLEKLQSVGRRREGRVVSGLVLTRPPEIVSIVNIPTPFRHTPNVLALFDSHPRSKHPNGAAFTFFAENRKLAGYLAGLWHVDAETLRDAPNAPWENQLLSQFSGHFFVSRDLVEIGMDEESVSRAAAYEANTMVLDLKNQLSEQTSKARALADEKSRLIVEITKLRADKNEADERVGEMLHTANERADEAEKREALSAAENTELRTSLGKLEQDKKYAEDRLAWIERKTGNTGSMRSPPQTEGEGSSHLRDLANGSSSQEGLVSASRRSRNPFANPGSPPIEEKNPFKRMMLEKSTTSDTPEAVISNSSPTHSRSPSGEQVSSTSPPPAKIKARPSPPAKIEPGSSPAVRRQKAPPASVTHMDSDIEMARKLAQEYAEEEERRMDRIVKAKEEKRRKEAQENEDLRLARQFEAEMNGGRPTSATRSSSVRSSAAPRAPASTFIPAARPRDARASVAEFLGSGEPGAGKVSTFDADRKIAMEEAKRYDDEMRSRQEALRQQEEEERIRREHEELLKHVQETFNCVVCMEDHPIDIVTNMEGCEHRLCREAVKDTIVAKLDEHRFPILCPLCVADPKGFPKPGAISGITAMIIGLNEQQYTLWQELEMSAFSIMLDCAGCRRQAFVDREDLQKAKTIRCPMGCGRHWCKQCNAKLDDSLPHSCDGSLEMDRFLESKSWKKCPGCQTPIEKMHGCNHMTCGAPGCNMHFCWVCGESIVRSVLQSEIKASMQKHYAKCKLFDDVAGR